ncbi:MAG: 16S rRNA (cytosine(1402)-N(4))-methyltransferase RsmH [Leptospirillia bacterium]
MGTDAQRDDYHIPVLVQEVHDQLAPQPGGVLIDMTLGGGGHAAMLLDATSPDGRLLGLDQDPAAIRAAGRRLKPFGARAHIVHARFDQVADVAAKHGFTGVDGILMDLGVSSRQLDDAARGFSFSQDGPLDMRMNPEAGPSAADLVNTLDVEELSRIFKVYGEERHAWRIAKAIVAARDDGPFTTTAKLAHCVADVVPKSRDTARIHPATRVFQALRIAVNEELATLEKGLDAALTLLAPGGRLAVISFHSLEDRIVKHRFVDWSTGCICPREFPECRCGQTAKVKRLTRRAVRPTEKETAANPRARSSRLRAVEMLPPNSKGAD